jgi:predicted nucleotidyltransferase
MAVGQFSAAELASTPSLAELRAQLGVHLPELAKEYHVKALGLFGSYVRREQTPQSDLDVLVEFDEPPSLFEFIRLENQLSDLVGLKVDLVMKEALKPAIGRRILQECVPV